MRSDSWATWAIGAVLGTLVGFAVMVFGTPFLVLGLALLALAFVAARSLALLSGAFMGVGGIWLALLVRATLACDAFDADPNQGCQGFGVEPFMVVSAIVFGIGVALGALAWRRRAAQERRAGSAGGAPLSR